MRGVPGAPGWVGRWAGRLLLGGGLGLGALLRLLGGRAREVGGGMNAYAETPLLRRFVAVERVIIEPVSRKCYFV